ncbi:MAG: 50S ribosomal protein L34 [Candidatus Pacebacteria bacterium]|nr:50S ribosomal protein L34 [Candidatus Paceibacterota bacterium]
MSRTYQPKNRKRNKTHGFLVRSQSKGGKNILKNRRRKGRSQISV